MFPLHRVRANILVSARAVAPGVWSVQPVCTKQRSIGCDGGKQVYPHGFGCPESSSQPLGKMPLAKNASYTQRCSAIASLPIITAAAAKDDARTPRARTQSLATGAGVQTPGGSRLVAEV